MKFTCKGKLPVVSVCLGIVGPLQHLGVSVGALVSIGTPSLPNQ